MGSDSTSQHGSPGGPDEGKRVPDEVKISAGVGHEASGALEQGKQPDGSLVDAYNRFKGADLVNAKALPGISDEVKSRARSILDAAISGRPVNPGQVSADVTLAMQQIALQEADSKVVSERQRALVDELTGLRNKNSFKQAYRSAVERAIRNKKNIYVVMLDMDHFKDVNDKYGHHAGDVVLKDLADLLKKLCRESEQPFRIGGEKFVTFIDAEKEEEAVAFCERIRNAVSEHEFRLPNGDVINKTISIGLASLRQVIPEDVDPRSKNFGKNISKAMQSLQENADSALYAAKGVSGRVQLDPSGRNRITVAGSFVHNKYLKLKAEADSQVVKVAVRNGGGVNA